jgi:hypothetical protein
MEGNTGFYFVRSNALTLKLWEDAFAAAPKSPKLDDQAVFWNVIRRSTDPPAKTIGKCRHFNTSQDDAALIDPKSQSRYLISCILDVCVFNSGALSRFYLPEQTYESVLQHMQLLNESVVTVHANYLSGNKLKMQRMQEHHLWLAEYDSDAANNFGVTSTEQPNRNKNTNTNKPLYTCKPYVPLPPDWKYPHTEPVKL